MRNNTTRRRSLCVRLAGLVAMVAAVPACSGSAGLPPDDTGREGGVDDGAVEGDVVRPDTPDAEAGDCRAGDVRCGADGRREVCVAGGRWEIDECPAATACTGAGTCAPVICLPGDGRCEREGGRTVERCNASGTAWETAEECPAGQVCEHGRCVATACTPGETTCTADGRIRRCNPSGSGFLPPESCPSGEACDGTSCRPVICTPGETACSGTPTRRTCNAIGTAWVSETCPDGTACSGGACLTVICRPSDRRCDPANPLAYQTCDLTGTTWSSSTTCPAGQGCVGGSCRTQVCTPGETMCAAGGLIQTCDPSGTEWSLAVACPAGSACSDGTCRPVICTPGGGATCVDSSTRRVCNDVGTDYVNEPCSGGYVCVGGACTLQICPPGLLLCASTTTLERCNATGTGFEPAGSCNAARGERCYMGVCQTLCQQAELAPSSVGCVFYGVDLDQADELAADSSPYAIVVSNINTAVSAVVRVEDRRGAGGTWRTVLGPTTIAPNNLNVFRTAADQHVEDTGRSNGFAFRVTSDVPVIAYQFNPIDSASQYSNDASLLLPRHTLHGTNYVASWRHLQVVSWSGYLTVVGAQDGTSVTIRVTTSTLAGGGIPALSAGGTYTTTINEGDVLQIATAAPNLDLTGSLVTTTGGRVAVFGGTECADVPQACAWCRTATGGTLPSTHGANTCAWCDHIEEQMFPVNTWGQNYIAARTPRRSTGTAVEAAFWRVLASVNATTVTINAPGMTLRFPPGTPVPYTLNAGQYLEFQMTGPAATPGDALITANNPIMVVQYIEGQECTNVGAGSGGDPAMILMVPVEQYLPGYVFQVPSTYTSNFVAVIRRTGESVTLDGSAVTGFITVAPGYEVARPAVSPGVRRITGSAPFGILGVGYSPYVSYGYMGGLRLQVINPL